MNNDCENKIDIKDNVPDRNIDSLEQTNNYIKQSFDKLINLYGNSYYQKYYLEEINKINNEKQNINEIVYKNEQINETLNVKKPNTIKIKLKSKNKKNILKLFCDGVCHKKFLKIIQNINNKKKCNMTMLDIIKILKDNNKDIQKLKLFYEFINEHSKI